MLPRIIESSNGVVTRVDDPTQYREGPIALVDGRPSGQTYNENLPEDGDPHEDPSAILEVLYDARRCIPPEVFVRVREDIYQAGIGKYAPQTWRDTCESVNQD